MRKTVFSLSLLLFSQLLSAQSSDTPPADFMRSMGKMYVVVGVIILVFLGLAFYLWSLDRRLTKLEDQNH